VRLNRRRRGTWAVVTGASSGVGEAYARRLARDGYDLVITARRAERLEALAEMLRDCDDVDVQTVPADLSRADGVDRLFSAVDELPVDVFVHAAGFGTRGTFVEIEEARTLDMIGLHVVAPVRLVRAFLPHMIESRRGTIVLVSSLASLFTTSRYVTYSATKRYLNQFALGLADELVGTGVRVQAIIMGLTRTEFLETEEYADFDYSEVPDLFWMTADQVVDEAMRALENRRRNVLFVPGIQNRIFVGLLESPVGPALRKTIAIASRFGEWRSGGKTSKALF
jgi:short-subunit dehydrogenase